MAITGTFQADFSGFIAAVDKAEIALVDMSKGASKVESSLNRITDNFSGRKLIQEASLMTIAIENAGGVSKLTARELEIVGGKAQDAADKMKRLGYDVPPGLQNLADRARGAAEETLRLGSESKGASTHLDSMKSLATNAAAALGAFFTIRAGFGFVKDVLDQASALKDLSNQTHIGVEDLQILAGGMSEFGVDAETLGKGLFKLSQGIAGGDESVTRGLHLMGMSLKDVQGLQGKELFLKIEEGLSKLQGGLRDTAAAELFGGKLGAAMAGASEGIQGTLETWQRLNHVASTESVDAMDTFGESIARAQKNISSIAANMIGPLAQGFNVLNDSLDQGASKMSIWWAMTKDAVAASAGFGTGTERLTKLLDEQNQKTAANAAATQQVSGAHAEVTAAVDTRTQAEKFMAALEADAAAELTITQLRNLDHLKEIGALNAKNAAGIGVNAAQLAKYNMEQEQAKKDTEELGKAEAVLAEIHKTTFGLAMDHEKQWREEIQKTLAVRNKETVDALTTIQKAEAALRDFELKQALDTTSYEVLKIWETVDEQEKAFQGSEAQRVAYNAAVESLAEEQAQALIDKAYDTQQRLDNIVIGHGPTTPNEWSTLNPTPLGRSAGSGSFSFQPGGPTDPVVLGLISAGYTLGEAMAIAGGYGGHIGPPHPRALGGPVTAGNPYRVGELGPEVFVPSSNGTIVPNGGGGTQVIQIVLDGRVIAEHVNDYNTKNMRRSRQWPSA